MSENFENLPDEKFSDGTIEKIVGTIIENHSLNGGATVNRKGENLIGQKFFAVVVFNRSLEFSKRELPKEIVRRFVEFNADLLENSVCAVGTWFDESRKISLLEISLLIADEERAVRIGKMFNQIAIYDLEKRKEINLGGNGILPEDKQNLTDKEILQFIIEDAWEKDNER